MRHDLFPKRMAALAAGLALCGCGETQLRPASGSESREQPAPLRIAVLDPLALPNSCACVAGYAQRDYDRLAAYLERALGRTVKIGYGDSLGRFLSPTADPAAPHLIIGKFSTVSYDAGQASVAIRPLALLTDLKGRISLRGVFLVRAGDPAATIDDLGAYRILLGPEEAYEKHGAALATLEGHGIPVPPEPKTSPGCNVAAIAVLEKDADAAVVSDYAVPLLTGCGAADTGTLRAVGETAATPFVCVFATETVTAPLADDIGEALAGVAADQALCKGLESSHGFVLVPAEPAPDARQDWADWRGPGRRGFSSAVPKAAPANARLLWQRPLTGLGMAGVAVADGRVFVADKDLEEEQDVFRCLDAFTGAQLWRLAYPALGDMDFSNSPRATPVVEGDLVYLLGAFGDLHCVRSTTGAVVWHRNILKDVNAELPTWGTCSTPLVVDDKLIVNPGAEDASLMALNRHTGQTLWRAAGGPPGYSSFILARLGGLRQIVGYDGVSLGGWAPDTGRRLWTLIPEHEGDFNVPTPIELDGKLLVSSENNGTRLYDFHTDGTIIPEPVAANPEMAPDTATPVVVGNRVYGSAGGLYCLDLDDELKTLWMWGEDPFFEYCTLVAGDRYVLGIALSGEAFLVDAKAPDETMTLPLKLFDHLPFKGREVWSHFALTDRQLFVRDQLAVYCFLLD